MLLTRATGIKAALTLCATYALLFHLGHMSPTVIKARWACSRWNPGEPAPPDCLRARQFHELQAFHASGA
jgi:hypothetical protein